MLNFQIDSSTLNSAFAVSNGPRIRTQSAQSTHCVAVSISDLMGFQPILFEDCNRCAGTCESARVCGCVWVCARECVCVCVSACECVCGCACNSDVKIRPAKADCFQFHSRRQVAIYFHSLLLRTIRFNKLVPNSG